MGTPIKVDWSDDLLTGDSEIDGQHKAFFVRALRVIVACDLQRGQAEVVGAFQFMDNYVAVHFRAEEARMRKTQYPYFETHREAHQAFKREVLAMGTEIRHSDDYAAIATGIAHLARGWFVQHIRGADRPFIEFLKEHGRLR